MKKIFVFLSVIALSVLIPSAIVSAACSAEHKDETKAGTPSFVSAASAAKPSEEEAKDAENDEGNPSDPEVNQKTKGEDEDNMDKETTAE